MKRLGFFMSAVISGLSLPATALVPREPVRSPAQSDRERMRSDWIAVGDTMRIVIDREKRTVNR